MKNYLGFFGLLFIAFLFSSNVSQPGVFNSGGTAFTMLFSEDSLAYKKVQMQQENISIQLYKGYAVVKGKYKMVNTSSEKLSFTMGYPVKGIYNGGTGYGNEVSLDSIYKFKIRSNNQAVAVHPINYEQTDYVTTFQNDNWLTWKMEFLPFQINYVEVYFIVNTNNAQVVKGYARENYNAFIYLLESGKVWKQPIEKGTFLIELKDNLTVDAIHGISTHFNFKKIRNKSILVGFKNDFSPSPSDNLLVTYNENSAEFDFEKKGKNKNLEACDIAYVRRGSYRIGSVAMVSPYDKEGL